MSQESQEELLAKCHLAEEVRNYPYLDRLLGSGSISWGQLTETRRRLVSKGDDVCLIRDLCQHGSDKLLRMALKERPDLANTIVDVFMTSGPLHMVAALGHFAAAAVLIEAGARIEQEAGIGITPLQIAAAGNSLEVVKLLCKNGADVYAGQTSWDSTPLILAAEKGYLNIVKVLLDNGAEGRHLKGRSPLYWAAFDGRTTAVVTLVKAGLDVNFTYQRGWTPLHGAARYCDADAVEALLKAGAKCNAVTPEEYSPLHQAALGGKDQAVKLLLRAGAKTTFRERDGRTAYDIATKQGHINVILVLDRFEAEF